MDQLGFIEGGDEAVDEQRGSLGAQGRTEMVDLT